MSKCQSPTTVLFRTTLTRTITQYELLILLGSNHLLLNKIIIIFIQLEDEEIDDTDEDELEATGHSQSTDQRHEYYRQPVFLSADKCPYLPHVLHFVRLATGTVLVLVCEVRN